MATKKKKSAAPAPRRAVHAEELVDLEAEINECRDALNDAVGRYNDALEAAKVDG